MPARPQPHEQTSHLQRDSPPGGDQEWAHIQDPNERRKVQNKLAQRRFREKAKEQKEEQEREAENQKRAGSAYASPEPGDLNSGAQLSGLPWGGISMGHIIQAGRAKEQSSQQSSRENSVYAAASRTGGSSRMGLQLSEQFARGHPSWRMFPWLSPEDCLYR